MANSNSLLKFLKSSRRSAVVTAVALLPSFSVIALAADDFPDRIMLRSGAELFVKILADEKVGNRNFITYVDQGGSALRIDRKLVAGVIRSDEDMRAYHDIVQRMPATVEGNWEMIQWCKDQPRGRTKFEHQIRFHLENIIAIEPEEKKARKLLGYEEYAPGQWMLKELRYQRYGYIRHDNSWAPSLILDIDQRSENVDLKEGEFRKRFKQWQRDLRKGKYSAFELQQQLVSFMTPADVPFVYEEFAKEEPAADIRRLFIEAFGSVPCPASAGSLVWFAVKDPVPEHRERAITLLQQPQFDRKFALDRLGAFLTSKLVDSVRNAALGIRELVREQPDSLDRDGLLKLTRALVTTHTMPRAGAIESGRIETSFRNDGSTSFTSGGGPQTVTLPVRHDDSLDALRQATGQDFGFNELRWQQWIVENMTNYDADVRLD